MAFDPRGTVECPVCGQYYAEKLINSHVNKCLEMQENETKFKARNRLASSELSPPLKRRKQPECVSQNQNDGRTEPATSCECDPPQSKTKSRNLQGWGSLASGNIGISKPRVGSLGRKPNSESNDEPKSRGEAEAGERPDRVQISPRKMTNPTQGQRPRLAQAGAVGQSCSSRQDKKSVGCVSDFASSSSQLAGGISGLGETFGERKPTQGKRTFAPLAEQMRPSTLEDYIGQDKALGKNTKLRSLLKSHNIPSMILWGPPGCGKTTLARIIAQQSKRSQSTRFVQLSATTCGIADVKAAVKIAKSEQSMFKRQTILFIDEVHRFNKTQQDSFLPHVEDGTIILIGATTENPSFQVNNALLSRCRVIVLEKLPVESIEQILQRALHKLQIPIRSGDNYPVCSGLCANHAALTCLAHLCDGDARVALNSLQWAVDSKKPDAEKNTNLPAVIGVEDIKEGLQRASVQYDRAGEEHYNCASALQKSVRGSDDNAAIYWTARMLEGGEDPLFIARRLLVCASEDIGLADPQALVQAVATFQACHFLGMPECAINLAQCVTYLARAPKSIESYAALQKARQNIREYEGALPGVPLHLRNAPTKLMKDLGYGKGYKYNHAFDSPVDQEYLPKELQGVTFFGTRGNS